MYLNLNDIEAKALLPGLTVRFVHTDNMTLAYWHFDEGTELPEHDHPHEQVVNIIEGKLELTVDGVPRVITPGDVVILPGGVKHSGKALTEARVIDVFYPVRENYR